jgi:hypothetical protein
MRRAMLAVVAVASIGMTQAQGQSAPSVSEKLVAAHGAVVEKMFEAADRAVRLEAEAKKLWAEVEAYKLDIVTIEGGLLLGQDLQAFMTVCLRRDKATETFCRQTWSKHAVRRAALAKP